MNSKICQKCDFLIIFTTENVIFYMELLERKIDKFLIEWKQNPARKPLIVNGSWKRNDIQVDAFLDCNQKKATEIVFDGFRLTMKFV